MLPFSTRLAGRAISRSSGAHEGWGRFVIFFGHRDIAHLDRKSTRLNSSHFPYTTLFRSCSIPIRNRAKRSAPTPRRSINRRSDVTRADAQRACCLFPLAWPVALSRGAVERMRVGDDLSYFLVTVISLT